MSSSVASMTSSLKKSLCENSNKSNKKTLCMNGSYSNKSLKSTKEIGQPATPLYGYKKQENKENMEKKGTIPVKNIKQRICGGGLKEDTNSKLNTTIVQNIQKEMINNKKFNETINNSKEQKTLDKDLPLLQQKQQYYFTHHGNNSNKDSKMTIKSREKSGLMDFTAQLMNTEDGESNLGQPRGELSLDQFELGRKLGKGRFGDVFMAR